MASALHDRPASGDRDQHRASLALNSIGVVAQLPNDPAGWKKLYVFRDFRRFFYFMADWHALERYSARTPRKRRKKLE